MDGMENPFARGAVEGSMFESPKVRPVASVLNVGTPISKRENEGGIDFEVRRSDLTPIVRSYADRLYASIKKIYAKYGVSSVAELHAKIASGQKPKNLKPGELKSDSAELSKLVADLKSALEKNAIPEGEPELQGFFLLRNVPNFHNGLPSPDSFKDIYRIRDYWRDDYREGRSIDDFALTDGDLQAMGTENPKRRQEMLSDFSNSGYDDKAWHWAKIIDLGKILEEKKVSGSSRSDVLTVNDIFEYIVKIGCRPATLAEALIYAKLQGEGSLQSDEIVPQVYALASFFSDSEGNRYVPHLVMTGEQSLLYGRPLVKFWDGRSELLVFRK